MHRPTTFRVSVRRGAAAPLLAASLCLALMLLAACGASSSAQGFPTPTDIPATPGTAQLNGCPEQTAPASPKTADVVVQGNGVGVQSEARKVSVNVGQTLEVDLPATFRWALVPSDGKSVLTAPAVNGWFDAGGKGCVWQFTAAKAGSATLTFGGGQVCPSASTCPDAVTEQSFDVTVR